MGLYKDKPSVGISDCHCKGVPPDAVDSSVLHSLCSMPALGQRIKTAGTCATQVSVADRGIVSTSHAETVAESPPGLQAAITAAAAVHAQGERGLYMWP